MLDFNYSDYLYNRKTKYITAIKFNTDEITLNSIDIKVIESYLRNKKLKKLNNEKIK